MTRWRVGLAALAWLASAGSAGAEPLPVPASRLEVGASVLWLGHAALGGGEATLTPNELAPSAPFVLFRTRSVIDKAAGLGVRLSWRLSERVRAEGVLEMARPRVRTDISSDVEAPGSIVAKVGMTEYAIGAGATVDLAPLTFRQGRGRFFVGGTVGYMRQLLGGGAAVETGRVYHVGGGVKYALRVRSEGRLRRVGLRVDLAVRIRDGGIQPNGPRQPAALVGGGIFLGF